MILRWVGDLIRAVPPEDKFGSNELDRSGGKQVGRRAISEETLKAHGSGDKDLTPENKDFIREKEAETGDLLVNWIEQFQVSSKLPCRK